MVSQIVLCCLFAAQAMLRYGAFDVSFPKKIDYDQHARRPRDHHAPKDGFKGAHWDRSRLSEVSESLISESLISVSLRGRNAKAKRRLRGGQRLISNGRSPILASQSELCYVGNFLRA